MKQLKLICLFFCLLFQIKIALATHFTPVFSGNPYNPMSILVTGVLLDNSNLESGDEIGVFDGNVCVAAAVYQGESIIGISISMDDPTSNDLDGFKLGDSIYFRVWKQNKDLEYVNISILFDSSFDRVFNAFGTAIVFLNATLMEQSPQIILNQTFNIEEGASQNKIVGKVQVNYIQGDLGFELLLNEQNSPLVLDSVTGIITVAHPEFLPNQKTYILPIRAYSRNNHYLSDTSFCTVKVVSIPPSILDIKNDTAIVGLNYKKVITITNTSLKELTVNAAELPSWLSISIQNNNEIIFEGIPGKQDIGESRISFLLSDEIFNIQKSYMLATIEEEKELEVVISNNPSRGPFSMQVNNCNGKDITVMIRKLDGNLVYKNYLENVDNTITLPINLSGNADGIYLVEVNQDKNVVTKKLLLQ